MAPSEISPTNCTAGASEQRVLVAAPTGRDAELLCRILADAGMEAEAFPTLEDLCSQFHDGAAAAIVAEEILNDPTRPVLVETLKQQPDWSDFPLIIVAAGGEMYDRGWKLLHEVNGFAHGILLERPVRKMTLLSSVRAALRSRDRQYQVRDELLRRHQIEQALKQSRDQLEQRVAERTGELHQQNRRLRRLAAQLTDAEQRERRKLAKTLHDGLQQILVAGKMQLPLCVGDRGAAAVKRLGKLLDDAIAASRSLSYELSPPALNSSDLPEALEWLARWFRTNHRFQVDVQVVDEFPLVMDHLKVFLFNAVRELLLNSVKHSGGKAAVVKLQTLRTRKIHVVVSDQGRGFDSTDLEAANEELHGFGLYSIRERLIALGGNFVINSSPGAGSAFTLSVPLGEEEYRQKLRANAPAINATSISSGSAMPADGPLRVMIVDDHGIVRQGLISLLQREKQFELVGEARDGVEAVELTTQLRPDVVLMDIDMPRMNGIDATRQIKGQFPEVAIIGLSFYEEQDKADSMRQAGASAYLRKGGDAEALFQAIRNVR